MIKPMLAALLGLALAGTVAAEPRNWKGKDRAASAGSSAAGSAIPDPDRDAAFKLLDLDGDGHVTLAEAAGNERAVVGFDRADGNRDGKLTREEYENIFKPQPARKARAKAKSGAGNASAGASR
jgi:hypothetical protein